MDGMELRPSGFVTSLEFFVSLTSHPLPLVGNRLDRSVGRCPSTFVSPAHVHVHSVRISFWPYHRRPAPIGQRPKLPEPLVSRTFLPTPARVPAGPEGRR